MELKSIIRRLSPVETCRLMGFNGDDYLDVDGATTSDSPRYKACGNSWGVNSAEWVNYRIERVLRELGYVSNDRTIQYATTCSGVEAHSQAVKDCAWNANFFSEIEKFPCRVLEWRYPHVPNLGDMTKVDGTKYDLDVFSGGTPCFTAGNMVLTETGYRPIEDIKVGELVVTMDGNLRKVVKVGKKKANNVEMVKIGHRPPFCVTKNHPFYSAEAKRDNRRKSSTYAQTILGEASFRPIGDFGENTCACLFGSYTHEKGNAGCMPSFPVAYSMNEVDIAEFAGWYVGDGYICRTTGKNKKSVVLCLNDEKLSKFESRFGGKLNYCISKSRTVKKVAVSCTVLAEWLTNNFGELSHGKTVPAWMVCCHDNVVKSAFLAGYMATDGCHYKNDYGFTTVSRSLAYGVADMIEHGRLYHVSMPDTCVIEGRVCNQRDQYSAKASFANTNKIHFRDGKGFTKIRWAKDVDSAVVYNIEVEAEHNYICNGYVVHNCQSVSVAGKRHGMAEDSGTRSSLAFHWLRIGREANSKILLWENVCGALSSNEGRDFAWFVHRIAEAGFAVAWRVMDVQHAFTMNFPRAIPQRRRRIWLVASADGDWRTPARILFERSSRLGTVRPTRVLNDGTVVDDPNEGSQNCDDLFSFMLPSGPSFTKDSIADMIPIDLMPKQFGGMAMSFLRDCGEVRYYGNIFRNDDEISPDNFTPMLLDEIGAGSGVAVGGKICTFKTKEWSGGIQLPYGVKGIPNAFNGTVSGLSDILLPWGDYLGKYLLSKRACEGIVRRAEKRGKDLPDVLKEALGYQIGAWTEGALDRYLKSEGLIEDDGEDDDEPSEESTEDEEDFGEVDGRENG